jgi:Cu(I)/Ag(I) efflux system membrane protein CusA/SilA
MTMIERIIHASLARRGLVLLAALVLSGWGIWSLSRTPVDAIPDLSDVQVIIRTPFAGQAPQVVQDQVTYPLTTAMLSVPKAETVRGFSFFGDSYVYVIFEEGTDLYWARSRVLEYLNQVSGRMPPGVTPSLGPDATGVGWVYQYALVDRTGNHDLSELRSLQDWFLKYELQAVDGVSEIASVGGMVRQYQVTLHPERLRALGIPLAHISQAIKRANRETGASVVEMAEAEYMLRATGYIQSVEDLEKVPLGVSEQGTPLVLGQVADIQPGPQPRRGIAELNGEGEVVGGIVVMRYGANARDVISRVKDRLDELRDSLPEGVEVVPVYDRGTLIDRAVENLFLKLGEEFLVVVLVCALFLFHFRSSLVVLFSLPVGLLTAFGIMHLQGLNANIMSLGGLAIAIGAMVDGAIVMIENLHKHLERDDGRSHWEKVGDAATEVGPALFFSLLIITLSFVPIFALEAQEGKLFAPLAFTKTWAMAASAGLAVTLVPVLAGYLIRGHITPEHKNPVNRWVIRLCTPLVRLAVTHPWKSLGGAALVLALTLWPYQKLGSEFMPPLDEGTLMYMPTTYAGISVGKARQLLQQTDRLIKTVPEVDTVFGKIGRADTATDPAPLTMIETIITFRPKEEWRDGMTKEKLRRELENLIKFPGVSNAWVMPIKTRIDMLSTGIKTPLGIKVAGPDLGRIQEIGKQLESILENLPGTASVYSERVAGGRYITVDVDRTRAARHGLNIDDVHEVIRTAIGGMNLTETVEGLERYPVNMRYPARYRDSPETLRQLPLVTARGQRIALGQVADVRIEAGPPMIKSENARLNGWTLVDIQGVDLGSYVRRAQQAVDEQLDLPAGYALQWSGQYEYMQRAKEKLAWVVPLTVLVIALLLYANFRSFSDVAILLGTLPFACVGGIWLMYLLGYNFSVAVAVGFIALAGVAVEIGVIMLLYLQQAWRRQDVKTMATLRDAVLEGAGQRVRPIVMTVAVVVISLLPVMRGGGAGGEVMQRVAAPMVGGMLSTLVLTLLALPALFYLRERHRLKKAPQPDAS